MNARLSLMAAAVAVSMAVVKPPQGVAAQGLDERILVMPFENVTRDAKIFWLSEAAAVLLTDDLNAMGARAITREERREAFDRLQVPPAAALSDATVMRLGQLVGAAAGGFGEVGGGQHPPKKENPKKSKQKPPHGF